MMSRPPRRTAALSGLLTALVALALVAGTLAAAPTAQASPERLGISPVKGRAVTDATGTSVRTRVVVHNRTGARTTRRTLYLFLRELDGTTRGLGRARVPAMGRGTDRVVRSTHRITARTVPGRYYVLACLSPRPDGSCRASQRASVLVRNTVLEPTGSTDLAFADTPVGDRSAAMTVTVTNAGTSRTGRVRTAFSGAFRRAGGTCGESLAPGASCTVGVVFVPTTDGDATGSLIVSDRRSGRVAFDLTGTGLATTLGLSPTSYDFGTVVVGTTPTETTFTVTNTGSTTAGSVTPTLSGDTDFSVVSTDCADVAPAATCEVVVGFAPGAPGTPVATLSVDGEAVAAPVTSDLSVEVIEAAVLVTPLSADFGDVAVGSSSDITFVYENFTDTDTYITDGDVNEGNGGHGFYFPFLVTDTCLGSLAVPAHGTCTVTVRFDPGIATLEPALGTHNDVFRTAGPLFEQSIPLTGEGVSTPVRGGAASAGEPAYSVR